MIVDVRQSGIEVLVQLYIYIRITIFEKLCYCVLPDLSLYILSTDRTSFEFIQFPVTVGTQEMLEVAAGTRKLAFRFKTSVTFLFYINNFERLFLFNWSLLFVVIPT